VDIVTAGFPCQPFSKSGEQLGEDDERNCWPDTARILGEVRPKYVLLENIPEIVVSGYFGRVLGDLSEAGYDARWDVFSAAGVGAPHLRKRIWICARLSDSGGEGLSLSEQDAVQRARRGTEGRATPQCDWWSAEPDVGRVAHGVASRVGRIRALGNGQVPGVVVRAWRELSTRFDD
jgi:DNA (cytosine-5)-methyltransferase 1